MITVIINPLSFKDTAMNKDTPTISKSLEVVILKSAPFIFGMRLIASGRVWQMKEMKITDLSCQTSYPLRSCFRLSEKPSIFTL
jgi:hypothetical protein